MILKINTNNCTSKESSQKKMAATVEERCPLCLDILELDDINFYPCKCGYQVCRFCWHRIRTNENGLCPACRRQYPEDPANFKPLSPEEFQKLKSDKKMKDLKKKKEMAETRKLLANTRVVQKNLVFVHGLPMGIDSCEDKYRRLLQTFKDYGPVLKCVINNRTNYAGSQSPRASAYVTFQRVEDALKAYKSLPTRIEGHDVKTSLGTTKYCSNFLKNLHCPKQDCMYLHELADEELCFTKEQIHAGAHLEFGNLQYEKMCQLHSKILPSSNQSKELKTCEPEIEVQSKPSCVPIKGNDHSNSCSSDESSNSPRQSNNSPRESSNSPRESDNSFIQSRFKLLFSNRKSQNLTYESEEIETQFGGNYMYNTPVNNFASNNSSCDTTVQRSLTSEENTVNNTTVGDIITPEDHIFHGSPNSSLVDTWFEPRNLTAGRSSSIHNLYANNIPNEVNILNAENLSRLSLNHTENGKSVSSYPRSESPVDHDDGLGFDPIQISLNKLDEMMKAQGRSGQTEVNTVPRQQQRHPVPTVQQQACNIARLRQMQELQRQQRNPPPGFDVNNFPSNQPLSSPVYEPRNQQNVLISRMSPVMNVSNSFSPVRPNFPAPRFQNGGVSLNSNSMMNGFSSHPVRTLTPQPIPLQPQAMHELIPRSTPTSQHIQSQSQNMSQMQFNPVDQNISPPFWNMNQSQWMPAENSFQNQSMADFRPSSPLLNLRRMQLATRPADYTRQIQQARFNISPFSDNTQYMCPNAQHNQLTKGVHTFP